MKLVSRTVEAEMGWLANRSAFWRSRPTYARTGAKVGGGGGSRTRVRKYAVAGIYMRSRS
jgi:hypothetical protein